MKERVLFLTGTLKTGGQERQLMTLLENLPRDTVEPAVLAWAGEPGDRFASQIGDLDIPLWMLAPEWGRTRKTVEAVRRARAFEPTVVQSFTFFLNPVAALLGAVAGARVSLGAIQNDFHTDVRDAGLLLGRVAALVPRTQVANSELATSRAGRHWSAGTVRIVFQGLPHLPAAPAPWPDRERPLIAAVGNLRSAKRWDVLLDALRLLADQGADFDAVVAGSGPCLDDLLTRRAAHGLADRVTFPGEVADVAALLAEASVLAHTAQAEGLPNVILEAMAAGRPIVTTDVGDGGRVVKDADCGCVVPIGDAAAVAAGLRSVLDDPERSRVLGRRGFDYACANFDPQRFVTEMMAMWRSA